MVKPSFEDWLASNKGDLRYEYAEYLANKKLDHLVEQVFWWEAITDAKKAREAWETWLWATFEEYVQNGADDDHDR